MNLKLINFVNIKKLINIIKFNEIKFEIIELN